MRTIVRTALVAGLVLLMRHSLPAQPQFRAGTELVVVDVVATRVDDNVARHLTVEDFEIYEDGVRQPIRTFQFVDLEANTRPSDPTGVFSNQVEPGAVFAIVVDELSVEARHTPALRRWTHRFVQEQVRPDDYLGVMNTGSDFALLLTRDHDLVETVLAQVSGRGTPITMTTPSGRVQSRADAPDAPTLPDFSGVDQVDPSAELRMRTEQTIRTLRQVVEFLSAIPARRKSIVFFSQGIGLDLEALVDTGLSRGFADMGQLLDWARAGNVAIYGLDPRGLMGDDNAVTLGEPQAVTADAGIDGLRDLARATGGRAFVNSNDLSAAFQRIADENRAYFLIGYEPQPSSRSSGSLRRIEVKSRAAGVSLLHRAARVASTESRAASRDLEGAPLPGGSLAVALAPAMYPDPEKGVSLSVPFEIGSALERGTTVSYSLAAIDTRGRHVSGTKGRLATTDGRAVGLTRLQLSPGRYQLRLSARSDAQEGLALADVSVPSAGADSAVCGGFLIVQKSSSGVRPNVNRRIRASEPLMVSAVVSSREPVAAGFEILAQQGGVTLSVPVPKGTPIGSGWWRYELALGPPLPRGAMDLLLLQNDVPIPGCRSDMIIE